MTNGQYMTALEIQALYLDQAKQYLIDTAVSQIETKDIIDIWQQTLHMLEEQRESLVGRVDWITKYYVLQNLAPTTSWAERKKCDLQYHDLVSGPFQLLDKQGVILNINSQEEIEEAMLAPPNVASARRRAQAIKTLAYDGAVTKVSWNKIKHQGPLAKVLQLFRSDH